MNILLCDDDDVLATMVQFKLSRENFGEVTRATNGKAAIELLGNKNYDLVITDIHMPFHSGLEIITHIRQILKQSMPIIVLSAEGLENTVLQAFEIGANDFITKPFSPAELAIRIKRLLGK